MDFIKNFENKVLSTIKKYNLLNKKEKVLVACSGGKDSTTILYILKKYGFNVEAIFIDLLIRSYSKTNFENIKKFCFENKIKLHLISFRHEFGCSLCYLRSVLASKGIKLKACTICGVLKRYILNKKSKQLKAKKLVLGHNLDDEAQTILMNMLRGNISLSAKLGPKVGLVQTKNFVTRVKPLYFCYEKDTKKYSELMKFPVLYGKCPCSVGVYRAKIRQLLNQYEKINPKVKINIINNFLKNLPKIKEYYSTNKKINLCQICNEPSQKDICMACQILSKLE